jgi:hypothetical protein
MKTLLLRVLPLAALFSVAVPVAAEADFPGQSLPGVQSNQQSSRDRNRDRDRRRSAPEFDPAAIGAIVALLGSGALVFSRSKKA